MFKNHQILVSSREKHLLILSDDQSYQDGEYEGLQDGECQN